MESPSAEAPRGEPLREGLPSSDRIRAGVERDGFAVLPRCLDEEPRRSLIRALDRLERATAGVRRRRSLYAARNLLSICPEVVEVFHAPWLPLGGIVRAVVGEAPFLVRGLLFEKNAASNWSIRWHQDRAIAVKRRHAVDGYRGWSVKEGVPHVLPPPSVLEGMLAVRIDLDPSSEQTGGLQVVPGSHRHGVLQGDESTRVRESRPAELCRTEPGGVVLMRPLCLHASAKATKPVHRRVIHVEVAACELPEPLEWHERHEV